MSTKCNQLPTLILTHHWRVMTLNLWSDGLSNVNSTNQIEIKSWPTALSGGIKLCYRKTERHFLNVCTYFAPNSYHISKELKRTWNLKIFIILVQIRFLSILYWFSKLKIIQTPFPLLERRNSLEVVQLSPNSILEREALRM